MGGFLSRGRIISNTDPDHEDATESATSASAPSTMTASTTSSTPAIKATPKSKPTLASKNNANSNKKPPKIVQEDEYQTSSWSGTAPKIQELADGEE